MWDIADEILPHLRGRGTAEGGGGGSVTRAAATKRGVIARCLPMRESRPC
jgi:hypothetical protein